MVDEPIKQKTKILVLSYKCIYKYLLILIYLLSQLHPFTLLFKIVLQIKALVFLHDKKVKHSLCIICYHLLKFVVDMLKCHSKVLSMTLS